MLSIYDFKDYRKYLNTWIQSQKSSGHGQKGVLARSAGVSSTLISLILSGQKHLTLEQANDLAEFLGLNENEVDYFFLLVEYGRAGTQRLQQKLKNRILTQQEQAKKISRRVQKDLELSEAIKAIYYSNWLYTATRNLSAIPGVGNAQNIADRLRITNFQANKVLKFLLEHGLCRLDTKTGITHGPAHTHLDSESPFVSRHHQNWRLQGFQVMNQHNEENLFYTCPMSLSKEAASEIRRLLPKVIEQVLKIVGPSPSEKACCFNIDWFEY